MGSTPDIAEQDLLWGKGVGYVMEEEEEEKKKKMHYTRVLFSVLVLRSSEVAKYSFTL